MSEYVQFAGALILFVGILVGSYSFVLTSPSARERAAVRAGARGRLGMRFRDREK